MKPTKDFLVKFSVLCHEYGVDFAVECRVNDALGGDHAVEFTQNGNFVGHFINIDHLDEGLAMGLFD